MHGWDIDGQFAARRYDKGAANVSQQLGRERKLERASLKLVRERAVCQELLTDPFVLDPFVLLLGAGLNKASTQAHHSFSGSHFSCASVAR
jgi:hypothetical protein